MNIIGDFANGLMQVLKVMGSPLLYRYPYRTSAEALRTDWMNIGKDIESVMGQLESEAKHGQRPEA